MGKKTFWKTLSYKISYKIGHECHKTRKKDPKALSNQQDSIARSNDKENSVSFV